MSRAENQQISPIPFTFEEISPEEWEMFDTSPIALAPTNGHTKKVKSPNPFLAQQNQSGRSTSLDISHIATPEATTKPTGLDNLPIFPEIQSSQRRTEPKNRHRTRKSTAPILRQQQDRTQVQQPRDLSEESSPLFATIADFEEIFTRFQTPLSHFIYRKVGDREQANDLVQDVFFKVYKAFASGSQVALPALPSWLYKIASNTATDALRRRRLIAWLPFSVFNGDRGIGAGITIGLSQDTDKETTGLDVNTGFPANVYNGGVFENNVVERDLVNTILSRLPKKYRDCLLLYEYQGFSCLKIGKMLNISPSAVKMSLMRARERFIKLYREEMSKDQ